ncbi:hypothetical protein C8F04DRAFT_1265532 [Mycena alexandri]|uniref:Uncharacterized protein n=1 Tax=Mycena alexandri TaxID=1745969 RepID=A0AAD6SM41_9AGAR|nr:hypothetical protein C8F04DRAFT_1265532 [Mycena alexandri]
MPSPRLHAARPHRPLVWRSTGRYRGPPFDPSKVRFFKIFAGEYHLSLATSTLRHFYASVIRTYLKRFGYSPPHMPYYGFRVKTPPEVGERLAFAQGLRRRIQEWFAAQDPVWFD